MDTDDVTQLVERRGGFDSRDQTRRVITEVLLVLRTWDLGGEAANLAAQLPRGLGELLVGSGHEHEELDEEAFLARVQEKLDFTRPQTETAVRAVLSSMVDAVSEGERTDFLAALPHGLAGYSRWS